MGIDKIWNEPRETDREAQNANCVHKSFEERLAEYNGEIAVCDFDWGEPVGREML